MRKKLLGIVGILVAMVVLINTMGISMASAQEVSTTQNLHYVLNGKEFNVIKVIAGDTIKMDITSPVLKNTLSYVIEGDLVHMTYGTISTTVNKSDFISNKDNDSNVSTDATRAYAASVNYGNKVYSKYDDRYYYCWGYSGSADYLKIGCNLNYQIRYDTLSSIRKENVKTYTNGIDDSNAHYNSAVGYIGAESVAALVALAGGIAAIAAIAPEALFVALCVAGFTGTLGACTAAITELVNGNSDFNKASNIFDTIKGYGTQI